MYLAIRTSDKISEIYLLDEKEIKKERKWEAGRELSKELLTVIDNIIEHDFDSLKGLIVFAGPGSFTGLRIGVTTMNALAYGKNLPIVGTTNEDWLEEGAKRLKLGEDDKMVIPEYGSEAHITLPKK